MESESVTLSAREIVYGANPRVTGAQVRTAVKKAPARSAIGPCDRFPIEDFFPGQQLDPKPSYTVHGHKTVAHT
jgi:hypothetical protein